MHYLLYWDENYLLEGIIHVDSAVIERNKESVRGCQFFCVFFGGEGSVYGLWWSTDLCYIIYEAGNTVIVSDVGVGYRERFQYMVKHRHMIDVIYWIYEVVNNNFASKSGVPVRLSILKKYVLKKFTKNFYTEVPKVIH